MSLVKKRTVGQHEARVCRDAQEQFAEVMGPARAFIRSVEIERLPTVEWKGKTLRTIRCEGPFGRGPHDVNVPHSVLWSLISLQHFTCPYHR
jgi:hypothetical protein